MSVGCELMSSGADVLQAQAREEEEELDLKVDLEHGWENRRTLRPLMNTCQKKK